VHLWRAQAGAPQFLLDAAAGDDWVVMGRWTCRGNPRRTLGASITLCIVLQRDRSVTNTPTHTQHTHAWLSPRRQHRAPPHSMPTPTHKPALYLAPRALSLSRARSLCACTHAFSRAELTNVCLWRDHRPAAGVYVCARVQVEMVYLELWVYVLRERVCVGVYI